MGVPDGRATSTRAQQQHVRLLTPGMLRARTAVTVTVTQRTGHLWRGMGGSCGAFILKLGNGGRTEREICPRPHSSEVIERVRPPALSSLPGAPSLSGGSPGRRSQCEPLGLLPPSVIRELGRQVWAGSLPSCFQALPLPSARQARGGIPVPRP